MAASSQPKRFAVIGAGLAGLATAWHLLDACSRSSSAQPVEVHVFDGVGIGAGGSGAAAGLLHAFTPKAKLLWRGEEAIADALQLLAVAEEAARAAGSSDPIAWRQGMLRPAANTKQAADFWRQWGGGGAAGSSSGSSNAADACRARVLSAEAAAALVPGLRTVAASSPDSGSSAPPSPQQQQQQRKQRRQAAAVPADVAAQCAALHIPGGVTLHPQRYLAALWAACQHTASERCAPGSAAVLHIQRLESLQQLCHSQPASRTGADSGREGTGSGAVGAWDAVVAAAGAAVGSLQEFRGRLPLDLCQGYTLHLQDPGSTAVSSSASGSIPAGASISGSGNSGSYPPTGPSLLGQPYLASQGGRLLIVGATQAHGWSSEAAAAECGRVVELPQPGDGGEVAEAVATLRMGAAAVWPPSQGWSLSRVVSGVRALPPRTPQGAIPLLGRWEPVQQEAVERDERRPPVWLLVGLGARGLVYHAWLGRLAATAVLEGSEHGLAPELLAWKELVVDPLAS